MEPWGAILIGLAGGGVCYAVVSLKDRIGYDDSLDVVGVHLVGGIVGALLTGVFATLAVNPAGADGSPTQFLKQATAVVITLVFSFGATMLLLKVCDKLVGLRLEEDHEDAGLDVSQHAETAYVFPEPAVVDLGKATSGAGEDAGQSDEDRELQPAS